MSGSAHRRRRARARSATLRAVFVAALAVGPACRSGPRGRAPSGVASVAPDLLPLVPRPRAVTPCPGAFVLGAGTAIDARGGARAESIAARLAAWLGLPATRVGAPDGATRLELRLEAPEGSAERDPAATPPSDTADEAYAIDGSPERIVVRAAHPAGLFYGAETIAALAGASTVAGASPPALPRALPCVVIEDAPRFRLRGMHLDVARHFFPKEVVERYVDLIVSYKLNVLHLHLSDDQGFRLAVDGHPELTAAGGAGGFYTHDDARAIVAYAKSRFVTVIPEIDTPGHTRAILASHPEVSCTGESLPVPTTWGIFDDVLCAGNPATYALLGDVLADVARVFPSRIVHLGGDEVPKDRWSACPKCRARMAAEGVGPEGLEGSFLRALTADLAAHGRRTEVWDDALDGGLAAGSIVTAWRGVERGVAAAKAGFDVVMAPSDAVYFNFAQSKTRAEPAAEGYVPLERVLAFDPAPPSLDPPIAAHVLGAEGALWTEHVETEAQIETMLLPRLAALGEALWSPRAPLEERARTFASRFTADRARLDAAGVRYFVEPPVGLRDRKVFLDRAALDLARPALFPDGVIRYTLDGSEPGPSSPIFDRPVPLTATTTVTAKLFLPGGRASPLVRSFFVKSALSPARPAPGPLDDGANYTYYEGDFTRVPDFAALRPVRSGRVASLAPPLDAFRAEGFALSIDGLVTVPADGVYRFVARADDGVIVDVDGARVLADDGAHAARESDGEIALAAGLHAIHVGYFQASGGRALSVKCEGPSTPLGPCRVFVPRE